MTALLLTVREAAAELGIGRDAAYALVHARRLRSVSIGQKKILVPRVELEAFIEREMGGGDDVDHAPPKRTTPRAATRGAGQND